MYILLLWGEMLWRHQLSPSFIVSHLRLLLPYLFFVGKSMHWCLWVVKTPYCDYIILNLFLIIHQELLYLFMCSCFGCINIYKGYILLLDCSLYHYIVSSFVSCYVLCFKVYFVIYKYCYPRFLKNFHLYEISFYIPLLLVCVYHSYRGESFVDSIYIGLISYPFSYHMSFVGAFKPLTFKVLIDRYIFIAILFFYYVPLLSTPLSPSPSFSSYFPFLKQAL